MRLFKCALQFASLSLLILVFTACQKDEIILNSDSETELTQTGQLKSAGASISYIEGLIQQIEDYVTSGDLEPGIANSLISKLENAKNKLEKGNEKAAMNLLQAVLSQLESLVGNGTIDSEVGEEIIFDTEVIAGESPTFIDIRDNREYKTILIGDQCWMAENLAYLPSVSGVYTPNPTDPSGYTNPYYHVYGYNGTDVAAAKATANYITYGVLYNWTAAMAGEASSSTNPSGVQGICPEGWHLPSDAEWTQLSDYLISNGYGFEGSGDDIAKAVAATISWNESLIPGSPGYEIEFNNSCGFSGLASGLHVFPYFFGMGTHSLWWSSTEYDDIYSTSLPTSYLRFMTNSNPLLFRARELTDRGICVRCLKD